MINWRLLKIFVNKHSIFDYGYDFEYFKSLFWEIGALFGFSTSPTFVRAKEYNQYSNHENFVGNELKHKWSYSVVDSAPSAILFGET